MFETEIHQYDATVTKYQREIEGPLGKEQARERNEIRFSLKAATCQMKREIEQKHKANRTLFIF